MLKILVDRALMWHISFLFDDISFDTWSIHVLCSRHNNRCKQSVPRFPLYMLWDLVLTSYTINSLPVCCSTNKLLKTWLGKAKFFAYVLTQKKKAKTSDKNTEPRFSITLKTTCTNSANLEQEKRKATKIVTYPLLWLASSIVKHMHSITETTLPEVKGNNLKKQSLRKRKKPT